MVGDLLSWDNRSGRYTSQLTGLDSHIGSSMSNPPRSGFVRMQIAKG